MLNKLHWTYPLSTNGTQVRTPTRIFSSFQCVNFILPSTTSFNWSFLLQEETTKLTMKVILEKNWEASITFPSLEWGPLATSIVAFNRNRFLAICWEVCFFTIFSMCSAWFDKSRQLHIAFLWDELGPCPTWDKKAQSFPLLIFFLEENPSEVKALELARLIILVKR